MSDIRQIKDSNSIKAHDSAATFDTFVLDKSIFSNIFDKDIKRVYVYKKAERLAKAIHLIAPGFEKSPALHDRLCAIAVGLVDAAIEIPSVSRTALSRELLALSSVLSIARSSRLLSAMNAEVIAHEAHLLLQEIALYEEPRLTLDETPTLASLAKSSEQGRDLVPERSQPRPLATAPASATSHKGHSKGHIPPAPAPIRSNRRDAITAVLRTKGASYIKDISTAIRDVSEKTIQRELQSMVTEGVVTRTGERRWTTYTLSTGA